MLGYLYVRRCREIAHRGAGATGFTVLSITPGGGTLLRFRLCAAGASSSGSGVTSGVSSGSGADSGVSSGSDAGSGVSSGAGWVEPVSAEEAGSFSPQDVRKRQRQKAAEITVSASFMIALTFGDISFFTRIISEILRWRVELNEDSWQVGYKQADRDSQYLIT